MTSCCPICLRGVERSTCSSRESEYDNGDKDQFGTRDEFQQMFFCLFERYVDLDDDGGRRNRVTFDQLNLVGFLSCGQCLKLMESFCQLYDQLKKIELFLNWKVETLKNVMKCAQRVPSRMKYFREFMGELEVEENNTGWDAGLSVDEFLTELVIKWRRSLIEKCSRKISDAFPNLSIAKWKPSKSSTEKTAFPSQDQTVRGINTASASSNVDLQEIVVELAPNTPTNDNSPIPSPNDDDLLQLDLPMTDDVGNGNEEESRIFPALPSPTEIGGTDMPGELPSPIPNNLKEGKVSMESEQRLSEPQSSYASQSATNEGTYHPLMAIKKMLSGIPNIPSDDDENRAINIQTDEPNVHELIPQNTDICTSIVSETDIFKTEVGAEDKIEIVNNSDLEPNPETQNSLDNLESENRNWIASEEVVKEIQQPSDIPSRRKFRLRATHRCPHCLKTYSSNERLHQHVAESHNGDAIEVEYLPADSDSDDVQEDGDKDEMHWTSSSSDTDEDFFDSIPKQSTSIDPHRHHQKPQLGRQVTSQQGIIPCPYKKCTETFNSNTGMNAHVINCPEFHRALQQPIGKGKCIQCPECKMSVNATKSCFLKAHIKSHDNVHFRLKCSDCGQLFKSVRDILIHRRDSQSCSATYDPTTSVKVEVLVPPEDKSTVGADDESQFNKVHAIIEVPQLIFICQIDNCGVALYSSDDMEAHKKLHGTFPCQFCKVEETYAPNLSIHELHHRKRARGSQVFSCPRCDFKCDRHSDYITHHVSGHLSLTHKESLCAICKTHSLGLVRDGKRGLAIATHFKSLHDLSNVTIPEDIKRCTIGNCNAYYLSSSQLIDHLRFHHGIGEFLRKPKPASDSKVLKKKKMYKKPLHLLGKYNCKDCGKSFVYLTSLRRHRINHHVPPDKIIHCSFPNCTKVFESKMELERHNKLTSLGHRSLTTEKVFVKCPTCGKSISGGDPCYLRNHLKSHETSNVCEQCGKAFKNRCTLETHKLTHSGPESWQFQCDVCSRKCRNKPKLEEHMRTHTKDKSFICQVCGSKYAHRHNLRIHVNSKHGDQVQDIPRKRTKRN